MDAWLDWIGFLCIALVAGWFFFRKQMAENELTEREEDARKNAPLFSSGEGLCGQEGRRGWGRLSPGRLRRIAARPNQEVFLSQQSRGPGKRPASLNITKALPDTVREGLRGILHFRNRYSRSSPFTSMRYLRIFDQRVLGLRPRSSAAPSCPEILPLVRLSALMI